MELHVHSHRWEDRAPYWGSAALAGFLGGAVLMVLELIWSAVISSGNTWETSRQIAAVTLGPGVLNSSGFDLVTVVMALVNHYVLGILFGIALAACMAPFHMDSSSGMALLAGAVFGVVLYVFNFHGMVYFFSWMTEMRGWPNLVGHMVFGMVAALVYWRMEGFTEVEQQAM
jgi:hypothetical protein